VNRDSLLRLCVLHVQGRRRSSWHSFVFTVISSATPLLVIVYSHTGPEATILSLEVVAGAASRCDGAGVRSEALRENPSASAPPMNRA
jgi:hypothetical protein